MVTTQEELPEDLILPESPEPEDGEDLPLTYPIIENGTYVLSEHFYDATDTKRSVIENLTMMLIEGKPLETTELTSLLDTYRDWSEADSYYLIPLLLAMVVGELNRS